MAEFLMNGLEGSFFDSVFEILGVTYCTKITFPYIEICGELIVVCLSDDQEPTDSNMIEITKKELNQLLNSPKEHKVQKRSDTITMRNVK